MGGASSKQKNSERKLNKQFFHAIKSNDVSRVNDLLTTLDVNVTDAEGKNGLHYVRSKEVAEILLDSGIKLDAEDERGKTPLHDVESESIAELLINVGANVKAMDKRGYTPLHDVKKGDVAELLINAGADVKATTTDRKFTPLHCAETREVAEILIDNGADLYAESVNIFGGQVVYTPLSSALSFGKIDVANCIIEHLPLEQLKEKPAYLNFHSNTFCSQHWDRVKQEKERDSTHQWGVIDKTAARLPVVQEVASTSENSNDPSRQQASKPLSLADKRPLFFRGEVREETQADQDQRIAMLNINS